MLEDSAVYGAMRAGAIGYLLKDTEADELCRAIKAAAAGQKDYQAQRQTDFWNPYSERSKGPFSPGSPHGILSGSGSTRPGNGPSSRSTICHAHSETWITARSTPSS